MLNRELKLTVPNEVDYIPFVDKIVAAMAQKLGFGKMDITKIELGLEEAIVNILQTAFAPDEKATYEVVLQPETIGLRIILREKGIPFDPKLLNEYDPATLEQSLSEEGLGVFLMQQFVDEVSLKNLGKEGKETHLFKYYNQESIEKMLSQKELQKAKDAIKEEPLPRNSVEFSAREITEKESVEISKCAYSSYGYTYINEDIYFPERIWKQNQSGELISVVSVTGDGKIMGHNALEIEERDPLFPQLGMAFVMPKYQGQGCMKSLVQLLIEKGKERSYAGIYARGITAHPYSQKGLLKFGFKDTAMLLSSGPGREYKGLIEGVTQRESVMLMSTFIQKPEERNFFTTEGHRKMIESIYRNLEVPVNLSTDSASTQIETEQSVLAIETEPINQVAHIIIHEIGQDILSEVQKNLRLLCIDRFETIYLHIKLKEAQLIKLVPKFEEMLFFFAGIMPASGANDSLILQYLNNYRIDFDKVMVASEMAEEIKAYISSIDPNQKLN